MQQKRTNGHKGNPSNSWAYFYWIILDIRDHLLPDQRFPFPQASLWVAGIKNAIRDNQSRNYLPMCQNLKLGKCLVVAKPLLRSSDAPFWLRRYDGNLNQFAFPSRYSKDKSRHWNSRGYSIQVICRTDSSWNKHTVTHRNHVCSSRKKIVRAAPWAIFSGQMFQFDFYSTCICKTVLVGLKKSCKLINYSRTN